MPATPPTTAARLKVHYSAPTGSHTMLFHQVTGSLKSTFIDEVRSILLLMCACSWNGTSFDGAQYAAAGSILFFPEQSWVPVSASSGYDYAANDSPSAFLQWGGRSLTDGTRVKLYLLSTRFAPRNDMRYQLGEAGQVDAVTNALNAFGSVIATVSGTNPVWYTYANVGQNDYLTHKARNA